MTIYPPNPAHFPKLDLMRLETPCFVIDEVKLEENLIRLNQLRQKSGAKILLALKAFALTETAPLISQYLNGVCASGLFEVLLGTKHFKGEVSCFSPAYKKSQFNEIAKLANHIIFNSPKQKAQFAHIAHQHKASIGLRVNPILSEKSNQLYAPDIIYAPATKQSRLGIPLPLAKNISWEGVEGLHIHALCEQNFPPLKNLWEKVEKELRPIIKNLKWINLGGGHHITRKDYQLSALTDFLRTIKAQTHCEIYIEPGEAVVFDAGILVGEVLDVVSADMPIAILDISTPCHMPDVLESPYHPNLLGAADKNNPEKNNPEKNNPEKNNIKMRLGGVSCLAGDVMGEYLLKKPLKTGDRVAFLDQAHYSMVKLNHFNGIPLPKIALWNSRTDKLTIIKQFGFDDFAQTV